MDHLPKKQKKTKIFPILGIITLVLGVFITLQAAKQNNDTRNRAQVPNSYPNSYPSDSPMPNPTLPPNAVERFVSRNVRIAASDFTIRIGNNFFKGKAPYDIKTYQVGKILEHTVKWTENNAVVLLVLVFEDNAQNRWELINARTETWPLNGDSKYIYYVDTGSNASSYKGGSNFSTKRTFKSYNSADNAEIICNDCYIEAYRNTAYKPPFREGYTLEIMHGTPEGEPYRLQPGYGRGPITAMLRDGQGNLLLEGSGAIYFDWVADSKDMLIINKQEYPGYRNYYTSDISISANSKYGTTVVTAYAKRYIDNTVLASASFPVLITDSIEQNNIKAPTCSIGVYADNAANVPPNYIINQRITKVEPGQTVVVGANFFNKTYKSYQNASNHVTLGPLFAFKDSNGMNCNVNSTSNTLECEHGLFMDQGASSVAFRVKYLGTQAAPATIFGTTFTSNGDTGSCATTVNAIPVVAQ